MLTEEAVIFDIQRGSLFDGPGVRTVVFFKGCNLNCRWCHNPESIKSQKEIMYYAARCVQCRQCIDRCPNHAISNEYVTDYKSCNFCGICETVCPAEARKLCGKSRTVDEIFDIIVKDKEYYDISSGGVTFSGGECMLKIKFLKELLTRCRRNNIHTAVDTAGNVPFEYFEKIIDITDIFLYDLKCVTEELHMKFTGRSNELILNNLIKLLEIAPEKVYVRIPIIDTFNANDCEMEKILDFLSGYKPNQIELLKYHKLGEIKRLALNMELHIFNDISDELMQKYKS